MRVYCAYSIPVVVLIFGAQGWKNSGLRGCFLELVGRGDAIGEIKNGGAGVPPVSSPPPCLPVKQYLTSSVHAMAHMLGTNTASSDASFLVAFES